MALVGKWAGKRVCGGPAMSINQEWHAANPMPKTPTMAQRVGWHLEHQQSCACRPIPRTVQKQIEKQAQRRDNEC